MEKVNSFCNCNKNNKIPRNKLNKEYEGSIIYTENYKALLKEIEKDNKRERYSVFMDRKNQHS